jgi:hypothetical protein
MEVLFLSAFAQSGKVHINFFISVSSPPVHMYVRMYQRGSPWADLHEI